MAGATLLMVLMEEKPVAGPATVPRGDGGVGEGRLAPVAPSG